MTNEEWIYLPSEHFFFGYGLGKIQKTLTPALSHPMGEGEFLTLRI